MSVALLIAAAYAAEPSTVEFHIESGSAGQALLDFADQARLQIGFRTDDFAALRAQRVVGRYAPEEALRKLLKGSGIRGQIAQGRVYVSLDPSASAPGESTEVLREVIVETSRERLPLLPDDIMVTGSLIAAVDEREDSRGRIIMPTPQVFGGGPSEDTWEVGREAASNSARGYGINLRGLGAGETLVLMNGRRLAASGDAGAFTDVMNIPLSAVERVEVLTDGPIGIFGADAAAGVVNFVMQEPFSGYVTEAGVGAGGDMGQSFVSQLAGAHWRSGGALLAMECYRRDALNASARVQARSDLRRFGGDNFDSMYANPGTIVQGAQTFAIPAGQDGTALSAADFVAGTRNLENVRSDADILPKQERCGAYVTLRESFGDNIRVFADGMFSRREADLRGGGQRMSFPVTVQNPFYVNPTGGSGPLTVAYNFARDLGPRRTRAIVESTNGSVSATFRIGRSWEASFYESGALESQALRIRGSIRSDALAAALTDTNLATAFNPFGDGSHTNPSTLAAIEAVSTLRMISTVQTTHLGFHGPVQRLPGGKLELTFGLQRRDETFRTDSFVRRKVISGFVGLSAPLVGNENALRGIERLQLSAGNRYENYGGFEAVVVPRFGIEWAPTRSWLVSGAWSQSARGPNLAELSQKNNRSTVFVLRDASLPFGATPVLIAIGNNAGLLAESGRTWSGSASFTSQELPGFSLGMTYFDTKLENRVHAPVLTADLLENPRYAGLVTRNPTQAQRDFICEHTEFIGATGDCRTLPFGAIADLRLRNGALLRTRGLDLIEEYLFGTSWGTFELRLLVSRILDFSEAESPGAELVSLVDTQNNPLDRKLRASLSWRQREWSAAGFVNYSDSYWDVISQPRRKVGSWTTMDLNVTYEVRRAEGGLLDGTRWSLLVENAFNHLPPFLNNHFGLGYDAENGDLLGRMVMGRVRKEW